MLPFARIRHDHPSLSRRLDKKAYTILIKTNNTGPSNNNQFTLPATGTYVVDWGDGIIESRTGSATHTYPAEGNYVIRVTGGLTRINFNNAGDRLKLLEIQNWGDIAWTSMETAYFGCQNMQGSFKDSPDLSLVTNCAAMFYDCFNFNHPVGNWEVKNITNMGAMFASNFVFNQDLSTWKTDNVTSFSRFNIGMFQNAYAFNRDISTWNTSNCTDMSSMFRGAFNFNQNISIWNVNKVTSMVQMFQDATSFNQNIGSWNLRLSGVDMTWMFIDNTNFSIENYSRTLIGWANYVNLNNNTPANVNFSAFGRKYNSTNYVSGQTYNNAVAARAYLVGSPPGWTISDGGQE